jgi:hypothetical protein
MFRAKIKQIAVLGKNLPLKSKDFVKNRQRLEFLQELWYNNETQK